MSDAVELNLTLEGLCGLAGVSRRTARYYTQLGLMDRPEGETRAARYGRKHLEQLLRIKALQAEGRPLDMIARELRHDDDTPISGSGRVSVWTRIALAPGLELQIDAAAAKLSTGEVRAVAKAARKALDALQARKKETR